ncbi:uncharacterized protein A4U43_C08F29650 [Asparagus officinalis]|nr:uncharacterized protein A4U43_C08F29650 [Asparagus officinalis]
MQPSCSMKCHSGGCRPDIVPCRTLIKGPCKNGNVSLAIEFIDKMKIQGKVEPNAVTYTTIIDALCKQGAMDNATKIYDEMIFLGTAPDVVTYSKIIDALCEQGAMDNASKIYEEMISSGIAPNIVIYSTIVDALCKQGVMENAIMIYEQMIDAEIAQNICHLYLHYAWPFYSRTIERSHESRQPDEITYSIVINSYCKSERVSKALKLLEEMPKKVLKRTNSACVTCSQG